MRLHTKLSKINLLILVFIALNACTGCEKKSSILLPDGSFKLMEHPEALDEEISGITFDKLVTTFEDRYQHGKYSSTEHRRGFAAMSDNPVVFDVTLPPNAVLAFEWGPGPEARMKDLRQGFSIAISQGEGTVVHEFSVAGREEVLNKAWIPETLPLSSLNEDMLGPGPARIMFFDGSKSDSDPEEKFRIANPRIYSQGRKTHRRVILIALDTLRADHLSSYGYDRLTSPAIDRLTGDGTRYDYCLSTSPWTYPSFSSIHTGKYPSVCGATTNVRYLPDEETTIAEVLSFNGFSTFMCVNHVWAGPPVNHHQGFDTALRFPLEKASVAFGKAAEWLMSHGEEDTFVYLQFMDTHVPYIPDPPFQTMFSVGYSGDYEKVFHQVEDVRNGELVLDANDIKQIQALYDGEIAYFDDQLSTFLDFIKDQDWYDETLIVFTSDHGEEFYEHGGFEHGHSLYDEQLHVPLIIAGPGIDKGAVKKSLVSTMDIFPTILDYFKIPPPVKVNGISLLSGNSSGRMLIAEQLRYDEEMKAVTTDEYRYIYHTSDGTEELYDLHEDPKMRESVAGGRRATSRKFRAFVENYVAMNGSVWYVNFQRAGPITEEAVYSGTITASGGFSFTEGRLFDESDTLTIEGDTIHFELLLTQASEKEIRFVLNDDESLVDFKIDDLETPEELPPIFIGPKMDSIDTSEFSLILNDERFNLGQPMLRREIHDGVFIWANPAPGDGMGSPELTDEMIEELRSIGYLN